MTSRAVNFSANAVRDIQWLYLERDVVIRMLKNLDKLAQMNDEQIREVVEDEKNLWLASVRCTDGQWLRMVSNPDNVRVFFTLEPTQILVTCILQRTNNTYAIAKILWKVSQNGVAQH